MGNKRIEGENTIAMRVTAPDRWLPQKHILQPADIWIFHNRVRAFAPWYVMSLSPKAFESFIYQAPRVLALPNRPALTTLLCAKRSDGYSAIRQNAAAPKASPFSRKFNVQTVFDFRGIARLAKRPRPRRTKAIISGR